MDGDWFPIFVICNVAAIKVFGWIPPQIYWILPVMSAIEALSTYMFLKMTVAISRQSRKIICKIRSNMSLTLAMRSLFGQRWENVNLPRFCRIHFPVAAYMLWKTGQNQITSILLFKELLCNNVSLVD